MSTSTVTSKGQITIPRDVRTRLNIETGDKVAFNVDDQGRVYFVPLTVSVASLKGIVPKPERPVSIRDMKEVIKSRGGRA
ncbi:MAG: AbrB/MazE/SpoVT family DNA-binding domain-containing protein [Parahaliea sp.]